LKTRCCFYVVIDAHTFSMRMWIRSIVDRWLGGVGESCNRIQDKKNK
jgi:hypothetical protein